MVSSISDTCSSFIIFRKYAHFFFKFEIILLSNQNLVGIKSASRHFTQDPFLTFSRVNFSFSSPSSSSESSNKVNDFFLMPTTWTYSQGSYCFMESVYTLRCYVLPCFPKSTKFFISNFPSWFLWFFIKERRYD